MALTAGVWANSNFDQDGDPRSKFIESVQSSVDDKIATIYGVTPEKDEAEIDPNAPFWSAMYRGLEKLHGTAKPTEDEVERAIAELESHNMKMEIDQSGEE